MLGMYADVSPDVPAKWASSTAEVVDVVLSKTDTKLENAAAVAGNIALIPRLAIREAGIRNWVEPVKRACAAGAVGVIIVNTSDELEDAMDARGLDMTFGTQVVVQRPGGKDENGASALQSHVMAASTSRYRTCLSSS